MSLCNLCTPTCMRTIKGNVITILSKQSSVRICIAPGLEADLALFRLDEPRFSGAHDLIAALVVCGAHRADRVMVAGRWRVIDGAPEGRYS